MGKKNKSPEGISVKKADNLVDWYSEVVAKGEMADASHTQGFMVVRPRAYFVWERIQEEFNKYLKKSGVRNAYFPLLIPKKNFKKEAKHAEGFDPELAVVEGTGKGDEQLAIRPTSETVIYDSFAKWIRSYRDLPLKVNQWCNVLRWEVKQTKLFLRTREFLWQEGHCAFADKEGAEKNMNEIAEEYRKISEDLLAVPVLMGEKSEMERFAGAETTIGIETLMPDGKALQYGTSHTLNEGFADAFGVSFVDEDGKQKSPRTTSWGFSTRMIGGMIMVHGDDKGLVLPPKVAETQVAVVPILFGDSKDKVLKKAKELSKKIKVRVYLDDRDSYSPGWKFSEWEMKGVPLRVEVGPKDLAKKKVTLVRRDTGAKEEVTEGKLARRVSELLEEIQGDMLERARKNFKNKIDSAKDLKELKKKLDDGKIVKVHMIDREDVEEKLKDKFSAASRILEKGKEGKCVVSGESTKTIAYVARSY